MQRSLVHTLVKVYELQLAVCTADQAVSIQYILSNDRVFNTAGWASNRTIIPRATQPQWRAEQEL